MSDEAGLAAERSTYWPFGEAAEQRLSLGTPKETKVIGERFDDTSGLHTNARYYDPRLGMSSIQPDWWEVTQSGVGTNRYSYSFNDPVNLADPQGNLTIVVKGADAEDEEGRSHILQVSR
ncbi:MAG: RHS repeat-associated core domain-containing protein [Paracoccaceae bacterium]